MIGVARLLWGLLSEYVESVETVDRVRAQGNEATMRAIAAEACADDLRRELDAMRVAASELLDVTERIALHERGHPGRPCVRSGWVDVETAERYVPAIVALRALVPPIADDGRLFARVPRSCAPTVRDPEDAP